MITHISSPNCGPRRGGLTPTLIVLHYTAMHSVAAACTRLCDPRAEVSAHYLVAADGAVIRMVAEDLRAWHAGAGEWDGADDINSRSIGIELDNSGTHPFAAPQMDALETLLRGIMVRWDIPAHRVIGHSDMAPGRKFDPGPHFDWARLARQGMAAPAGQGPAPPEITMDAFRNAARMAGYTATSNDETLLATTRLRYRQYGCGPLAVGDFRTLSPLPIGTKSPSET